MIESLEHRAHGLAREAQSGGDISRHQATPGERERLTRQHGAFCRAVRHAVGVEVAPVEG